MINGFEEMGMKNKIIVLGLTLVLVAIGLSGCTQEDPLKGLGYINKQYGFGFNPPEGWAVNESGMMGSLAVFIGPIVDPFSVNIVITTSDLASGETLASTIQAVIENYTIYYPNFLLGSESGRTINGLNAYEIVYTYTYNYTQGIYQIEQKQVAIEKNGKVIILTYSALETSYDAYLAVFEQSASSFKMS
jgi:hypothetical protein